MKPRITRSVVLLIVIAAPGWPSPAAASPPSLAVAADGFAVEGVTPFGRVAVTGLFRRVNGTIPGFERRDLVLEDVDGDGRVEVALGREITPSWSLWIAVDLATGEWGAGGRTEDGPSARLVSEAEVPAGAPLWRVPTGVVEVLVARPGEGSVAGAWSGASWTGGPADGDGIADGSAGVASVDLAPVGESGPAPESFESGDVLVAIEPGGLGYAVTRVGAGAGEVTR